jgi:hypothetical protein
MGGPERKGQQAAVSGSSFPASFATWCRTWQGPRVKMRGLDWIILWTLSLIWGGSFLFNEIALQGLPALTVHRACRPSCHDR